MDVRIGKVATFAEVAPDKAQVMKVLEEAAEVFSAWEDWRCRHMELDPLYKWHLLSECADVVQATCNLIAALGVEDFAPYMYECRKRNEAMGRM